MTQRDKTHKKLHLMFINAKLTQTNQLKINMAVVSVKRGIIVLPVVAYPSSTQPNRLF